MLILWVILGIIAWYGIGLIGSAIGLGSIDEYLIKEFGSGYREGGKKMGFLMALLGISNLAGAIIASKMGKLPLKIKWYWIR